MKPGSANVRSPEVLKRFRHRFIEFDEHARLAVETANGDLRAISAWLQREQLPWWKRELVRRNDKAKEAWREYVNARYGDRRMGKTSCVEERKVLERAKRRKLEAQEKIERIKGWLMAIERESAKLTPPLKRYEVLLDTLSPKAVARLDFMMDRLDEYMRPSSSGASQAAPQKAGGKEGGDASNQSS